MSINHWLEQAENLAIKMLKEQGKKPDMFKHSKAYIGESGSVMFSPVSWWGDSGDDNIIAAAANLLICCKYIRQPKNSSDPVKAMAAGRYIGRMMLALTLCNDPDVSNELKRELLKAEVLSESGTHAVNVRHDQEGGSREKKSQMLEAWATGKYSSRDACANMMYEKLFISRETARKHLRNTPDPT